MKMRIRRMIILGKNDLSAILEMNGEFVTKRGDNDELKNTESVLYQA